ncbi:MAG: calcium/sodium antiporter [Gammaproteobacteria bacterium]|nr:calcium/sodium antiporter [Gammaproteobacteria bacterium]
MLESIIAILGGFVVLVWGADRCVLGASATARNLGVSPLVIGLTIVGIGTSAPELLVSGIASWQGNPGLAIGNALGSNIANVALVIGVTALVVPLVVKSETLRREFPVLLAIMVLALLLMIDGDLSFFDGVVLLVGLFAMFFWLVRLGLKERGQSGADPMTSEYEDEIPSHMPMAKAVMWLVIGLVCLLAASRVLVWGAVNIALEFGISDLVIGLTIVAVGTSLPELSASVMSALKNEHDIAVGNVLGSNMINLLGVLAMPGILAPGVFAEEVLTRDLPVMIGLMVAFFLMAYGFRGHGRINRLEGAILLSAFIGYMTVIYFSSVS